MSKTFEEINERIRKGEAVVVTAQEMKDIVADKGAKEAARRVDVVTTATFGPMCSSGALINVGHPSPRIKMSRATLNGVPAYAGLAAVDVYLGATALPEDDPRNAVFPGAFTYGGGHVIEDLVSGKEVILKASGYGTDCYPRREIETAVSLKTVNSATLMNPRNGYQNYNVAVNTGAERPIYTYLGLLRPRMANANYCSAGQLSPLLNDPHYRTIGIGTRIFLGGGVGYVFFPGTQHAPCGPRAENGVPRGGAATMALVGDLRGMSPRYLRGVSIAGYGVSLAVGVGIPIPILDEEMAVFTSVRDGDIFAPVVDYGKAYPENTGEIIGHVSYAELRSGAIEIAGRRVRTAGLSSYARAREIAAELKTWIARGRFLLGQPVERLPGAESGVVLRKLEVRR
ncbi:MAG: homocysteine biosynthesis protein [Deltaproteobacteria bacterium]|nr:homocysteine biosynthesis protein [Deltaproteobacteria bacterium]